MSVLSQKKSVITIVILVVIVLVAAGVAVYYSTRDDGTDKDNSTHTTIEGGKDLLESGINNTVNDPDKSSDSNKDKDSQNSSDGSSADNNSGVSKEKAGQIAIDKYGGEIKEIGRDHYDGKKAWEVEVRNSNQGRIEVKVDMQTGEILNMEKDD